MNRRASWITGTAWLAITSDVLHIVKDIVKGITRVYAAQVDRSDEFA
jgi:hypothetical protein